MIPIKILVICGPTATGKTRLGISLASKFNGEIISADSRQVYKGMDIGTGKGLPDGCQRLRSDLSGVEIPYYQIADTRIWGYDLVEPQEEFSVSHYLRLMQPVIDDIISRGKLPIVVGGTGFYIQALINPPETIGIGINEQLRDDLTRSTLDQLKQRLQQLDKERFRQMNNSDQQNPRRLIRAIEVATAKQQKAFQQAPDHGNQVDSLWIGLSADKNTLKKRVVTSVDERATDTFSQEMRELNRHNFDWDSPAATATGYKEWKAYLDGDIDREPAKNLWINREHQYQKRQLTWFKAQPQIQWFDILKTDLVTGIEALIEAW